MNVFLSDIFIYDTTIPDYSKTDLLALEIKSGFLLDLAHHLGLTYNEWDTEGNLCFAMNRELRREYRQVLTRADVKRYLARTMKEGRYCPEKHRIVFPKSLIL